MPRIDNDSELVGTDALLALLDEFQAGFRQSRKGNWWRTWVDESGRALTLTVFLNKFGRWQYCVADADGPRWSRGSWDTEGEAIETLFMKLQEAG